ncbi:PREDICTED: uncharacterized protein LOC108758773 [Trachymyrmex cornetzi]|uniref:C2H2-type domain-containing protein n=1 Tax=Trachymyrmex cornetzi TaxID=471704 RepID=A0A195ECU3_9HYME|nr:PREDICTED: uncharacterized protein LOC108758773 [Trachymyrmex cornetzi]XP_018359376.1 PREDICTED: uncharacterized protein LOC108758773 [Trachymyrmex cornetzi]XP_018359377.1 PREDICTED: uncharacterized protein LOC108758773 [Trachymyrmex cornetzi]KYN22931.1 hypothetical protein ALC57_04714 [Trachymyrmex cornetzi]
MRNADVQPNARGFRVPAAVTLRECSVVIVGSTCRICGRDFKCESDVALHTRWRHNGAIGSLMGILDHSEINLGDISQKCDVCDMTFGVVSDLRFHKRLIHKHVIKNRGKRRKEMVRIKFKLNGVTTTDVNLDRSYIELPNNLGCLVDVCETSDSLKNERRQDDCARNIDLSLPNHVVDKSHMQYDIRPHEAANRYIVGKFASTKGDTIASCTAEVGKSLVEISNTPYKDAIPVSDNTCQGNKDRCYLDSQTTTEVLIKTFSNSVPDKENSRRINKLERRNVYCQSEILLGDDHDDTEVILACQSKAFDKPMFKQNSRSSECPRYSVRWFDKVPGTKETTGLANSLIDSVETIHDSNNNGKSYNLNTDAAMRLSPSLSRLSEKTEPTNSNVDDDVQEVLRITRGNTQSDINHESPNRIEREMLVQNAVSDTFTLPSQLEPEKYSVAFTNFEPSDYSPFVTESDYQFLANSFDKKLGIYFEDLQHYGIELCNDLPEMNNNLEKYWVYAPPVYPRDTHQDFFETWKQSDDLPYTSGLKVNDN